MRSPGPVRALHESVARASRLHTPWWGEAAATQPELVPVPSRRKLFTRMKPVINVEETVDRVVGRRTQPPDPLLAATSTRETMMAWRKALGGIRVPRGVYRFSSHEEADEWLWRMLTRPRPS